MITFKSFFGSKKSKQSVRRAIAKKNAAWFNGKKIREVKMNRRKVKRINRARRKFVQIKKRQANQC